MDEDWDGKKRYVLTLELGLWLETGHGLGWVFRSRLGFEWLTGRLSGWGLRWELGWGLGIELDHGNQDLDFDWDCDGKSMWWKAKFNNLLELF